MSAASKETQCKRWCFTINNPTDDDMFWEDAEHQEQFSFLAVQYEVGEQGTPHYQGFVILKRKNRLTWLKKNFNGRAHWEKTRGSDLEAAQYCMKDETHPPGSYRWRWGTLKECQKRRSREELEETVIEEVDDLKKKFKPAAEINSQVLARPGFLAAYNALTADMLGVYRPNLKIVTMVGPPGTGKSFAINTLPQGRQGNHRERRHLVRESNVDSHGVRGVRRADSTAEDAQATRSIPYGTRSQGRHEASNVHSGNHHKQHEARWLVQERRARREALRCTPCTLGQARLQQRDEQVLQDMRHLPGACARHGTGCDRHLDRQHSHLVHE